MNVGRGIHYCDTWRAVIHSTISKTVLAFVSKWSTDDALEDREKREGEEDTRESCMGRSA